MLIIFDITNLLLASSAVHGPPCELIKVFFSSLLKGDKQLARGVRPETPWWVIVCDQQEVQLKMFGPKVLCGLCDLMDLFYFAYHLFIFYELSKTDLQSLTMLVLNTNVRIVFALHPQKRRDLSIHPSSSCDSEHLRVLLVLTAVSRRQLAEMDNHHAHTHTHRTLPEMVLQEGCENRTTDLAAVKRDSSTTNHRVFK